MVEIKVIIMNAFGLHARPASQFVQKAGSFKSKVKIFGNNKAADGKSILAVMGMGLKKNDELTIHAEGTDEVECTAALEELVAGHFGEK